jgi:6-phosphogluconolactonase (cycloisomerase 2 family)
LYQFPPTPRLLDDRLFTLHELSSTLSVQAIPAAPNGTSSIIASVSITPPDPPQDAIFAAAEILIPPPTKKFCVPYIYVSNRNKGTQDSRGDTIAIFEHVLLGQAEGLKLVKQVYTGLDQVRGMEIGPGDERGGEEYLVAAGSSGTAGVRVFRRTEGGRNLELVAKNLEIPTSSSFVWL